MGMRLGNGNKVNRLERNDAKMVRWRMCSVRLEHRIATLELRNKA